MRIDARIHVGGPSGRPQQHHGYDGNDAAPAAGGIKPPVFHFHQPWARLEYRRQSGTAWAGLKALLRNIGVAA